MEIMFAVGYDFFRCFKEGLNHKTATKWYSDSDDLFPELTERFRPANLSKWIDFKFAIKADLEAYEKPYYRFPVFSDKVFVFNLENQVIYLLILKRDLMVAKGVLLKAYPQKKI
ncbi:hypothetical protein [Cytobacillus sp. NCCP-133]|uniref:hypothetical protein n=1 Tax=Cytobacillus sp. NCCP-133 TaxID=766848 RepID=UPI0022324A45|nr:hypothetical protein [Cytobacillus sp. NCCP-133]GLB61610.1 hypothetical protein NCCP133_37390 [Cytobacillus sp. NCCP-133]